MKKTKLYESIIWLRKRRYVDNKSIEEMAKEANTSEMTIRRHLEKNGLR